MSNIELSLVIPCFNEESILRDSANQIFEILDFARINYEIIFVDDYSRDNTKEIINDIISCNPDKKLYRIFHDKNMGRGGAVADGIMAARGDVVGFIDIDLEVHARYIPSFVQSVKNGTDIAIAHRIYKFHLNSLIRYFMSKGYIALVRKLLKINLKDTEAGFKFFNRERILPLVINLTERGWFWDTEIMAESYLKGYKIEEMPCLFLRNAKKRSTVNNIRDSIDYFKKLLKFRKKLKRKKLNTAVDGYWKNEPQLFSSQYIDGYNLFVKNFLNKRLKRISRLIDVKKGMKAVDVGCGSGEYAKVMLERKAHVTAVDYSRKMLIICDKKLAPFGKENFSLINCDASAMPLADDKFDLLVSVGLLDYIDDINKVLGEFKRVAKTRSKLIITIPKASSPFFFLRTKFGTIIRHNMLGLPPLKTVLSKKEVERTIKGANLNLVAIEPFYMTMWIIQCEKI